MPSTDRLSLREAVALGLIQGPAELLPISSSSHTSLVPWLFGWRAARLDPELRRAFEVALHGGAALGLLVAFRSEARDTGRPEEPSPVQRPRWSSMRVLLPAIGVPVVVGFVFESFIDRRLSRPAPSALGLAAGAAAMVWSERRWRSLGSHEHRRAEEAGVTDGFLLGVAQALALAPGVSRNGMTLAVTRARGFDRRAGDTLSWQVGMPVIVGAGALKIGRALASGRPAGMRGELAAGALSAFGSTLASARAIDRGRRARALSLYAAYRAGLAAVVMRRLWRERGEQACPGGRGAPR